MRSACIAWREAQTTIRFDGEAASTPPRRQENGLVAARLAEAEVERRRPISSTGDGGSSTLTAGPEAAGFRPSPPARQPGTVDEHGVWFKAWPPAAALIPADRGGARVAGRRWLRFDRDRRSDSLQVSPTAIGNLRFMKLGRRGRAKFRLPFCVGPPSSTAASIWRASPRADRPSRSSGARRQVPHRSRPRTRRSTPRRGPLRARHGRGHPRRRAAPVGGLRGAARPPAPPLRRATVRAKVFDCAAAGGPRLRRRRRRSSPRQPIPRSDRPAPPSCLGEDRGDGRVPGAGNRGRVRRQARSGSRAPPFGIIYRASSARNVSWDCDGDRDGDRDAGSDGMGRIEVTTESDLRDGLRPLGRRTSIGCARDHRSAGRIAPKISVTFRRRRRDVATNPIRRPIGSAYWFPLVTTSPPSAWWSSRAVADARGAGRWLMDR